MAVKTRKTCEDVSIDQVMALIILLLLMSWRQEGPKHAFITSRTTPSKFMTNKMIIITMKLDTSG